MEYFSLLKMEKEPFSNSPDPDFFFNSTQHIDCLQRLELAIRLRQGLNVVIGDVGLGKSTLCRQLLRRLNGDRDMVRAYLILDPGFSNENEFVMTLAGTLGLGPFTSDQTVRQIKAAIKDFLLSATLEKNSITALCIDEGQKLPDFCIEILREFLNFETNSTKLLQIVIFAQEEFRVQLREHSNFADRISNLFQLKPLSFFETQSMIRFRLERAGMAPPAAGSIFSLSALLLLYLATGGAPRKIIMACSKALLGLIISGRPRVNGRMMLAAIRQSTTIQGMHHLLLLNSSRLAPVLALVLVLGSYWGIYRTGRFSAPADPAREEVVSETPAYEQQLRRAIEEGDIRPAADLLGNEEGAGMPTESKEKAAEKVAPLPPPQSEKTETSGGAVEAPPSLPPPGILGSVRMRQGESLSKMIARVYGRFTPERLQMVLAANPGLQRKGLLAVDTPVVFPWPDKSTMETPSGFHVRVGQWKDFEEAYSQLLIQPESGPSLRLLPVLGQDNTVTYKIFLEKAFSTREEAEAARHRLDSGVREKADIIEGKDFELTAPEINDVGKLNSPSLLPAAQTDPPAQRGHQRP